MSAKGTTNINMTGADAFSDRIMTNNSKLPCQHMELVSLGLSKLTNTGHPKSNRVDIVGVAFSMKEEQVEEFLLEKLEKFNVELVMVIPRQFGCSILFDFSDMRPLGTDSLRKTFLGEVQRLCFSISDGKPEERLHHSSGSNWEDSHSAFGERTWSARPSLTSYEGDLT